MARAGFGGADDAITCGQSFTSAGPATSQQTDYNRQSADSGDRVREPTQVPVRKIDECRFEVPRHGRMNVPGLGFADERLMSGIRGDQCLQQVANVACLPGIVRASIAMTHNADCSDRGHVLARPTWDARRVGGAVWMRAARRSVLTGGGSHAA